MKNIIYNLLKITLAFSLVSVFNSCNDEETSFVFNDVSGPSNLNALIELTNPDTNEISVTLSGENASTFDVYFGDIENEESTLASPGETLTKEYAEEGEYILRAVAKNITGATSELSRTIIIGNGEMVVEPVDPLEPETLKLPIDHESSTLSYEWNAFGNATVEVIENPDVSGNNTSNTVLQINKVTGAEVWAGSALSLDEVIDFSNGVTMNINVWSPRAGVPILFKIEDADSEIVNGIPGVFAELSMVTTTSNSWETLTYNMSLATGFNATALYDNVVIFPDFGTNGLGEIFYFDDINFVQGSPTNSGENLLINGDFESENESWLVGVDDTALVTNITTDGGNSYYSVNVETAGNPFDVNMSQKVEIIQGNTYTLTFDAWSDVDREVFAGIGLSADPWTNTGENIQINTIQSTYSLTLSAAEFGAENARVIFDLGADTGMVNIDNVSLTIDGGNPSLVENIAVNGDFESENESWIVGVDDTALVTSFITEDGNTYYSVNVETAGNPFDVNMSQKVEIIQGNTYTLTFDAWSDIDREIFAGIGLSADPWTNTGENIQINATQTTFSLTLSATEFGAIDARIIFDLGASVGKVNIDNVSLLIN